MVMPPSSQGFEDANLSATGYQMHCKILLLYSAVGYVGYTLLYAFCLFYICICRAYFAKKKAGSIPVSQKLAFLFLSCLN